MNRPAIIGGAAVLLVGAFLAGRFTAPTPPARVETRTVTVDREVRVEVAAKQTAATETKAAEVRTRTITRWLPSPAGPVVEQVTEADTRATSTSAAVSTETRAVQTDRVRTETVIKLVVQPDPDKWRVGVTAGLHLDAGRVYGVTLARRIVGPAWVEAWGTTYKAAGLGLALTW